MVTVNGKQIYKVTMMRMDDDKFHTHITFFHDDRLKPMNDPEELETYHFRIICDQDNEAGDPGIAMITVPGTFNIHFVHPQKDSTTEGL